MKLSHSLFAAGALALGLACAPASAMPAAPGNVVSPGSDAEQIRMVCNAWGQCWWRPGYGYRRGWGGPGYGVYGGGWGHRRGWGGGGWGHRRHW